MTLYSQRDSNIRKTWFLLTFFFVLIIGIGFIFAQVYGNPGILYFAIAFSVLANFFTYWYSDKIVLSMTRAEPLEKKDNPDLYNIVENLSITAGLPMPKIYVVHEEAPNAFATGRNAKNSVIAVTDGLVRRLDRTEVEGVISHELSHIGNHDMLLGTIIVILAGFIATASNIFLRTLSWGGGRRRDDERGVGIIFLTLAIIGAILAPLAATLIRLAISRKREFLADASGALLTRYPEGLASALEKISQDQTPMRIASNATAHLFIVNPFKGKQAISWFTKLFMTHPPIEERIKALRELNI